MRLSSHRQERTVFSFVLKEALAVIDRFSLLFWPDVLPIVLGLCQKEVGSIWKPEPLSLCVILVLYWTLYLDRKEKKKDGEHFLQISNTEKAKKYILLIKKK